MPPGLLGTELSATPPQYRQTRMEEKLFPPISRKSAISLGSETDSSDYCGNDRKSHTRGSLPASISSSPVKFPTIDRANSTSVSSLPGSRAARHRSKGRDLRSQYCRSPSCPSHLDISRDFGRVDIAIFKRDTRNESDMSQTESSTEDTISRDENSKLPNIFSKDCNTQFESPKQSGRRDKTRERANALSLRRSESLQNAFNTATPVNVDHQSLSCREPNQRQGQSTALLLPIRSEVQVNNRKKKKKRRARLNSDTEVDSPENTPRNTDVQTTGNRRRYMTDRTDALEAIARENDCNNDEEMDTPTPRAIEINSSRKVKQWINGSRNSQNDSEIKVK